MAIINENLGGTDVTTGLVSPVADVNETYDFIGYTPKGGVIGWLKTFSSVSSGNADTNTVDKLVDSGATFVTDGVAVGMIIHNTTDDTFGIVSAVDSETSISIAADTQEGSAVTDVFPLGTEAYTVYATPKLQQGWYECNGQVLSDAESPYNGATLPDMNNSTQSFLRGANASGATGGADSHIHKVLENGGGSGNDIAVAGSGTNQVYNGSGSLTNVGATGAFDMFTDSQSSMPVYHQVVWIVRVK